MTEKLLTGTLSLNTNKQSKSESLESVTECTKRKHILRFRHKEDILTIDTGPILETVTHVTPVLVCVRVPA